ncbi:MAG: hypothetical protein EXR62_12715 [Chloroflexi bacterium]|nr:hypothetical protein [Chloroflexota bacterium]
MQTTEFTIDVQGDLPGRVGRLTCSLGIPDNNTLASRPGLLLTFSSTRQNAMSEDPYDIATRIFSKAGHYVLSFDLPNHGERINAYGQGIAGFSAAIMAGEDPFQTFVADGKAALDACLAQGIDPGNRIFACGVSRAGYCAIRLAAADKRIRGVAGLAPVTDWRRLSEFSAIRDKPEVAALTLDHWAESLAGRAVFVGIGHKDDRVGTDACVGFALRLLEAERATGQTQGNLTLHVIESEGHSYGNEWREAGVRFLLDHCNRS